jgi:hypothetical protein
MSVSNVWGLRKYQSNGRKPAGHAALSDVSRRVALVFRPLGLDDPCFENEKD